jgi:hypothetical protein
MRVSRLWSTLGLSFAALFGSLLPSVIATGATPAPAATWNAATNPAMEPTEGSLIACTSSNCYMGTDIGLVKSDLSMASWTTSAPGYSEVGEIFCTTSRCVQDNNYWTDATSTPVVEGTFLVWAGICPRRNAENPSDLILRTMKLSVLGFP